MTILNMAVYFSLHSVFTAGKIIFWLHTTHTQLG